VKITADTSVKGADKTRDAQAKKLSSREESRKGLSIGKTDESEEASKVKLRLSPQEIQRIKNRLEALPEIDEVRVAKIKKSLEDGSFTINYDRIADKLIEEAQTVQDLLNKVSP